MSEEQTIETVKTELETVKIELAELKGAIQVLITMGNLHQWVIDKAIETYRMIRG